LADAEELGVYFEDFVGLLGYSFHCYSSDRWFGVLGRQRERRLKGE
jgi:hypothetical protein